MFKESQEVACSFVPIRYHGIYLEKMKTRKNRYSGERVKYKCSALLCCRPGLGYQKAGQKHSINITNRSFEDVAKFRYLGKTLPHKNCMHEEVKTRLNSGNACCHLVHSLLPSRLLCSNQTIILPVILHGCETWSVTLREEHRLRVFENRVLRGMFGPKRDEVTGEWRKLHSGELHNLYSSPDIIRQIESRRMRWAGHVARMGEGRKK
jgi:hypothetical protein